MSHCGDQGQVLWLASSKVSQLVGQEELGLRWRLSQRSR